MKIKQIGIMALCSMASSIAAMAANHAAKDEMANEQEELMNDAQVLAEHLGCTDERCI
jgi:hypothetical protein